MNPSSCSSPSKLESKRARLLWLGEGAWSSGAPKVIRHMAHPGTQSEGVQWTHVKSEVRRVLGCYIREHRATMDKLPDSASATMPQSYSARLANVVLPDTAGDNVRLGSLWQDRPAVVVFLRHYG